MEFVNQMIKENPHKVAKYGITQYKLRIKKQYSDMHSDNMKAYQKLHRQERSIISKIEQLKKPQSQIDEEKKEKI